jgi:carbamoyl-phosphate synthase large subunit
MYRLIMILARTIFKALCSSGVKLGRPLEEVDDIGLHPNTRKKGESAGRKTALPRGRSRSDPRIAARTQIFMNILFTSVGRRVELLKAFRTAYRALELKGRIIALDCDLLAPALNLVDRPYVVPRVDSSDYIPALVDICAKEEVDVVFPLIDPDIQVLPRHRAQIEAVGARLAAVSVEAATICGDKWLTAEFFQRLGLATPCTWLPGQIDLATAAYPLFIKPRNGSAAKNAFKVRDARELAFFSSYVPHAVIQECLPGPEITSDLVSDLDSELLAVVSRRRIEVRAGEVAKGITVRDPRVIEACATIARALPAVGPITVQCMMKNDLPYFTEINARFGGGVPLGIASGVDSPRWLLARLARIDLKIPPLGSYRTGCYMTRFDDSFFISQAEYDHMASHHI